MKQIAILIIAVLFFVVPLALSSCNTETEKKYCEGYTGTITNEQAKQLAEKCHFLSKDSIEVWTKKYDEYKKSLNFSKDSMASMLGLDKTAADFLKGSSVSFNNCIVKKILCNEKSIGLRVLYGIDGAGRIHLILVGIQPDYSNLYVANSGCCGTKSAVAKSAAGDEESGDGALGGAEYGQLP
jgi:hypothetical protein